MREQESIDVEGLMQHAYAAESRTGSRDDDGLATSPRVHHAADCPTNPVVITGHAVDEAEMWRPLRDILTRQRLIETLRGDHVQLALPQPTAKLLSSLLSVAHDDDTPEDHALPLEPWRGQSIARSQSLRVRQNDAGNTCLQERYKYSPMM
jgi:hypothetical protein